jgi:hypothetical protein
MAAWIYQLNPEEGSTFRGRFPTTTANLFRLEVEPGAIATWYIRQHFADAKPGHRVFVKMTGKQPEGIVAVGTVDGLQFKKRERYIRIRFDRDASRKLRERPIPASWLNQHKLFAMANLIDAREAEPDLLHQLAVRGIGTGRPPDEDFDDDDSLDEEGRRRMVQNMRAERNARNRARVLERRSRPYRCDACKLSFGERYGDDFIELIHVHHKFPNSLGPRTPKVTDFALLCPNCHALAHWKRPLRPRAIDELMRLYGKTRVGT